jgi:hypothetical protein
MLMAKDPYGFDLPKVSDVKPTAPTGGHHRFGHAPKALKVRKFKAPAARKKKL